MTRKIRFLLLSIAMLTAFSVGDASPAQSGRVFEGCWSSFPQGTCRAIYRDSRNNYFICGDCDSSGQPEGGSCSRISQQTLQKGFWCS